MKTPYMDTLEQPFKEKYPMAGCHIRLAHTHAGLAQSYFQGQMDNASLCKLVVCMERRFALTTSEKYDESYTVKC